MIRFEVHHWDSFFGALYELDKEDDWQDESNWIKANPSLGHTVTYKYLRGQVQSAKNNVSLVKDLNYFNILDFGIFPPLFWYNIST